MRANAAFGQVKIRRHTGDVASRDDDMLTRIRPVPGRPAVFQTAGLLKPADATLAPLYRTHFQRYAMYWQVTSIADWETNQRKIADAEKLAVTRQMCLDSIQWSDRPVEPLPLMYGVVE